MSLNTIASLGPWIWFAVAVALLVMETMVPGVHLMWFGVSAAATGALALMIPMPWPWQLIVFAIIAFAVVFAVRRYANDAADKTDEPVLNIRGAQYIGRTAVVEEAIVNGRGRIRIGDTVWGAEGEDAPKGASVEVTGVNGTVLVVTRPEKA